MKVIKIETKAGAAKFYMNPLEYRHCTNKELKSFSDSLYPEDIQSLGNYLELKVDCELSRSVQRWRESGF